MNWTEPNTRTSILPLVLIFFTAAAYWTSSSISAACNDSKGVLAPGDKLQSGIVPSAEEAAWFEICIKKNESWAAHSKNLGNSITLFLIIKMQEDSPSDKLAEDLEKLASFIVFIRDTYRWNGQLPRYHDLAIASKARAEDLVAVSSSGPMKRYQGALVKALSGIPDDTHDLDRIRFESLRSLIEQLQKSAQLIQGVPGSSDSLEGNIERMQSKLQNLEREIEEASHSQGVARTRGDLKLFAALSSILIFLLTIASFILAKQIIETMRIVGFHKNNIKNLRLDLEELKTLAYSIDLKATRAHESQGSQPTTETQDLIQEDSPIGRLPERIGALEEVHKELAQRTNDIAVAQQNFATKFANYGNEVGSIAENRLRSILPKHLELLRKKTLPAKIEPKALAPEESENAVLELKILKELWAEPATQSLIKMIPIEGDENSTWNYRFTLCFETLPAALKTSPNLQTTAFAACGELQDWQKKISTIKAIQHHIKPSPALVKIDSQGRPARRFIHQTRKFYALLLMLVQDSRGLSLHKFSFPKWIRGHFRSLADLIYREHWDRLAQKHHDTLEEARAIADEILSWGHLEVIPTPLGTRFDSRHQIGHSTASRPEFPDGTVAGVVRVGFLDTAQNQVIQKPEVVVNRR